MKQYIDKATVVAEIEKLQKYRRGVFNEFDQGFDEGRDNAFDDILSFLNTLEVKEADLEKGDIKNAFKAGYELGIQQKVQKGE